jgi:uncharacterized protein (DUF302 family)
MENYFRKTVIRKSFDTVLNELKTELFKEGFEIGGVTDFQQIAGMQGTISSGKYKILAVYNPYLYKEIIRLSPFEGVVLPGFISVIETYPGEVSVVPYNTTQAIVKGIQNPTLQNLTDELSRRLDLVIHALEAEQTGTPDLVTSWS